MKTHNLCLADIKEVRKILQCFSLRYTYSQTSYILLNSELVVDKMSIERSPICWQIFKMFVVIKINFVFSRI